MRRRISAYQRKEDAYENLEDRTFTLLRAAEQFATTEDINWKRRNLLRCARLYMQALRRLTRAK